MAARSNRLVAVTWAITSVENIAVGDQIYLGRPRTVRDRRWGGPVGLDAWRLLLDGVAQPVWLRPYRSLPSRPAATHLVTPWLEAVVASQTDAPDERLAARATALVRARNRLPLRRVQASLP